MLAGSTTWVWVVLPALSICSLPLVADRLLAFA